MPNKIFNTTHFAYVIRQSKLAKRISIHVQSDGKCVVSAPKYIPQYIIKKLVESKTDWVEKQIALFEKNKVSKPKPHTKEEIAKLKIQALTLVERRLNHFNMSYGYEWKDIRIKNQKTRWGSCSKRGNLNFNYKISLLPPHMADYIIVHELCHLGEFNHSKNFWRLVEKTIPDYREIQNDLKKKGIEFD